MEAKTIEIKLNRLSEMQAEREVAQAADQGAIDEIMAPVNAQIEELMAPIKDKIDALLAEVQPQVDSLKVIQSMREQDLNARIAALRSEIESLIRDIGQSVKGERLHAIYNKGRVTWDTKGLEGFMVAEPRLASFRKVGEAYVTFRDITQK